MRSKPLVRAISACATMVATLALTSLPSYAASPTVPDANDRQLIAKAQIDGPQRVIVQLKRQTDQEPLLSSLKTNRRDFTTLVKYHRFPLLALEADSATLDQLARSANVVRIQPDIPVRTTSPPAFRSSTAMTSTTSASSAPGRPLPCLTPASTATIRSSATGSWMRRATPARAPTSSHCVPTAGPARPVRVQPTR